MMGNDASQYQYGTTSPSQPDLPYTGFDALPIMGIGAILILIGMCIAAGLRERRR